MRAGLQTEKLDEGLYRTTAQNGVTVISEVIQNVRSVAVGVWVKTASAHETESRMGVSHLLEHMVFKGTERRSARDIALELELRGGSLDAFTAREHTSFQARVLDEDLPRALDVLTDLVRNPVLREADLELERKVILEEISTVHDTPDDLVFELHGSALWPNHPYGFSILGTPKTVDALTTSHLKELHGRAYHPRQVVIAAAGSLNHEVLLKMLAKCGWFTFESGPDPATVEPVPPARRTERRVHRDLAQSHIVLGTDTFAYTDERRYPLMLLHTVFGAGMSSWLFQRIREELGLAYAVYSFYSFYEHSGVTGVYVGTRPAAAEQAVQEIKQQLSKLSREGLTPDALTEAKQQLRGQVTLGLETPSSRMYRAAGIVLYGQPYKTIDQVLTEIGQVSNEQIATVADEFFDPGRQTVVWLGPS